MFLVCIYVWMLTFTNFQFFFAFGLKHNNSKISAFFDEMQEIYIYIFFTRITFGAKRVLWQLFGFDFQKKISNQKDDEKAFKIHLKWYIIKNAKCKMQQTCIFNEFILTFYSGVGQFLSLFLQLEFGSFGVFFWSTHIF